MIDLGLSQSSWQIFYYCNVSIILWQSSSGFFSCLKKITRVGSKRSKIKICQLYRESPRSIIVYCHFIVNKQKKDLTNTCNVYCYTHLPTYVRQNYIIMLWLAGWFTWLSWQDDMSIWQTAYSVNHFSSLICTQCTFCYPYLYAFLLSINFRLACRYFLILFTLLKALDRVNLFFAQHCEKTTF